MSTISMLSDEEIAFLKPFLPQHHDAHSQAAYLKDREGDSSPVRPFVTLTYACSLDGQISLSPGVRTTLSGMETKSMTHYLRQNHDAILIGVGTAIADSPSLNCRYPGTKLAQQPIPVVVDPDRRWQADQSTVSKLAQDGKGKEILIISRSAGSKQPQDGPCFKTLDIESNASGRFDWENILARLADFGIKSIMIEGGATILNELLIRPDLVDTVIVTIAPTWLGQGGVHVSPAARHDNGLRMNAATLASTAWKQFGPDAVLCGRLRKT